MIYEDGVPQKIENFFASEAPFEVALLLDTSGSTRSDLILIRRAARLFIDSLREGDRLAIIAFNTVEEEDPVTRQGRRYPAAEVVSRLTEDRRLMQESLDRVGTSNGTPYYDSLLQVADEIFSAPPTTMYRGRRALVALTDGVDSTSAANYKEAEELIREKGVATYFIQIDTQQEFEDALLGDCQTSTQFSKAQLRRYYNLFPREFKIERVFDFCKLGDFERLDISKRLYSLARDQMKVLADSSGGKVFPVADMSEARMAFRQVAADIGTSYSLGYYSSNTKFDGTFRRIRVELKGLPAGTTVRSRQGYKAPVRK